MLDLTKLIQPLELFIHQTRTLALALAEAMMLT